MRVGRVVLVAVVLLATAACGTERGAESAAPSGFDPDDGCSMAVGRFAISTEYVAWEDMLGPPYLGADPTYEPADESVLADVSLPGTLAGLPAQTMRREAPEIVVFYGEGAVGAGYPSDLAGTGGLVLTRAPSEMSDRQWVANLVSLLGDRITQVQVGPSVGSVGQRDADHEHAEFRPLQVNWVEGGYQFALVGVRDPAELVVAARELACGQDS